MTNPHQGFTFVPGVNDKFLLLEEAPGVDQLCLAAGDHDDCPSLVQGLHKGTSRHLQGMRLYYQTCFLGLCGILGLISTTVVIVKSFALWGSWMTANARSVSQSPAWKIHGKAGRKRSTIHRC